MTAFRTAAAHVATQVEQHRRAKGLVKASTPDDPTLEHQLATWLAGLDLAALEALREDFADILADVALSGARQGMTTARLLVREPTDFALPSDVVQAWANEHAAALVGKRILEDGTIIDNPNPYYAIDEATRDLLRATIRDAFVPDAEGQYTTFAELRDSLEQSYAFSEDRAELIARHEVGNALREGNLEAWRAAGVVTEVEWILSDLHDEPDECDDLAGQTFPLDAVPDLPHPRCECDVLPIVGGEE